VLLAYLLATILQESIHCCSVQRELNHMPFSSCKWHHTYNQVRAHSTYMAMHMMQHMPSAVFSSHNRAALPNKYACCQACYPL
jgi:hypothetical protein